MKTFLKIFLGAIATLLAVAYGAFTIRTIWAWHLLPAGYAVPSFNLTVGAMITLGAILSPITVLVGTRTADETAGKAYFLIIIQFVAYTISLLSGFVWHLILG